MFTNVTANLQSYASHLLSYGQEKVLPTIKATFNQVQNATLEYAQKLPGRITSIKSAESLSEFAAEAAVLVAAVVVIVAARCCFCNSKEGGWEANTENAGHTPGKTHPTTPSTDERKRKEKFLTPPRGVTPTRSALKAQKRE